MTPVDRFNNRTDFSRINDSFDESNDSYDELYVVDLVDDNSFEIENAVENFDLADEDYDAYCDGTDEDKYESF